ncbi:MAG: TAXI family TRAP transporter solute-binding subunit [Selenomonadales bacterium]|nr:TAXI family TRAP transporter solute-binding subunit [Selenomonadales bacterium]
MKLSKLQKVLAVMTAMIVCIAMLAGCGGEKKKFVNIATGGTAGTYYPLGGAMAEILNKNIQGMNASAQSTGASVANVNMLKEGKVDIGFIQNDIAYYAMTGTEMFEGKQVKNLQGISTLYPETIQIVTLAKDGITSVSQLKGKRVAIGAAGSGVEANARQILAAYGLTYDDIDEQYLSFSEAANGLKDGNIDAAFLTAGYPTAAVQDIAAQNPVAMLPVDAAKADALIAKYPFYTKTKIPAGTYPGQKKDVDGVAVMAMLVVTDKMSADDCYAITKALYSNLDRIKASHSVGALIKKETAGDGMSLTLNPGAEKFFKE